MVEASWYLPLVNTADYSVRQGWTNGKKSSSVFDLYVRPCICQPCSLWLGKMRNNQICSVFATYCVELHDLFSKDMIFLMDWSYINWNQIRTVCPDSSLAPWLVFLLLLGFEPETSWYGVSLSTKTSTYGKKPVVFLLHIELNCVNCLLQR